ncbi:MAG: flavodoxin family protein [Oscillospiraceae bacterium]|nr:flavodoxin family protein [Oscillospiraceae bacterium]
MKVIAFNGSPHPNGNTRRALDTVCAQLEAAGIETEIICVGAAEVHSCRGCNQCARNRDGSCVLTDDPVNEWIQKMALADGILLGSPVHFAGISAAMKAFLDRAFYVCDNSRHLLRHKVGAAVTAVRRSGGVVTADALYHYLAYSEMLLPTSNYWPVVHGLKPGQAAEDAEGMQILEILGRNMAWLMKSLAFSRNAVLAPETVKKVYTNFVR